jgi:outer membrane protein assembly factor BamC
MRVLPLLLLTALTATGCGMMESKKVDYQSAGRVPTLEVPPDLVAPTADNRYAIPDTQGNGAATLSTYSQERRAAPSGAQTLLPAQDKARIERAGTQRWLVVQATPQEVWPVIKDFWQETGFIINLESPETGVMETDWAENRAKLPQDAIRRTLGKVLEGLYSTAERDKFRTRIEAGQGGTEIYLSHRGMIEVYANEGKDRTVWQPRPADPELEAEMLRRLMMRFGIEESRAQTLLAQPQAPEQARIVRAGGNASLEIDEPFDRAWRRVGLALDRVGFAVEDRDRTRGTYFVRYIDPDVDNASKRDDGFLAKFAFWRSKKSQTAPQVRIIVGDGGDKSRVDVEGADAGTQGRILDLLHKELK